MNANEPVAWMSNGKEFYVQKNYCPDFIPLYTHPVKTLTTEEIKEIAIHHIEKRLDGDRFGYFEFANAVLKKAQEENNAKS